MLTGLLPFAVLFIELLFVFKNLWQDKSGYYYVFGFLSAVSAVLLVTVVEVTVIATYSQLSSEVCHSNPFLMPWLTLQNYHWWWQSFLTGSSSAFWVFAYCIWFYLFKLHVTGFVSSLLFFSYSFLACAMYGLLTGTIGFLAAYAFVRRVYRCVSASSGRDCLLMILQQRHQSRLNYLTKAEQFDSFPSLTIHLSVSIGDVDHHVYCIFSYIPGNLGVA